MPSRKAKTEHFPSGCEFEEPVPENNGRDNDDSADENEEDEALRPATSEELGKFREWVQNPNSPFTYWDFTEGIDDNFAIGEEQWDSVNTKAEDLIESFEISGETKFLDEAISQYQLVADAAKPGTLATLAAALQERFAISADIKDLEESISLCQSVLDSHPSSHVMYLDFKERLAEALHARYKHLGTLNDLDKSISLHREALPVQGRSIGSSDTGRSSALNSLAGALMSRYDELRQLVDLEDAITLLRLSMQGPSDRLGSVRVIKICHLALAMQLRYDHLRDLKDAKESIELFRQAKLLSPSTLHSASPHVLVGLADSLLLFAKTDKSTPHTADIEEGISLLLEALELVPQPAKQRCIVFNHLGGAYQVKFFHSKIPDDIDLSITHCREAINCLPKDSAKYPFHINLADSLRMKFEICPDHALINEAIQICSHVLAMVNSSHPERPSYPHSPGRMILAVYHCTHSREDLDHAINNFRSASSLPSGFLVDKFRAAQVWAETAEKEGHQSALDGYRAAIAILQSLSLVGLSLSNRYLQLMSHDDNLASRAAACAIKLGRFREAVEILEVGRGILWNQNASLRFPLEELRASAFSEAAGLAQDFSDVCRDLERGISLSPDVDQTGHALGTAVKHQQELSLKRDRLLIRIRNLPGFESFLLPVPYEHLDPAAVDGPIILVNGSQAQNDSLIILASKDVQHVPLPNLNVKMVRKLLQSATGGRGGNKVDPQGIVVDSVLEALALLWQWVVSPIAEVLENAGYGPGARVWWCCTGEVSGLPLHAAGIHPHGPNCIDRFISSYTPTISALLRARQAKRDNFSVRMLAIAMPQTPKHHPLPFASREIECVRQIIPPSALTTLEGPEASLSNVLNGLESSSWIHCACHAKQDLYQPFDSCFYLHNESLTLEALVKLQKPLEKGPQADFAFLAACHTASARSKDPDEAIYLASTLQFAGFRSIIGSMWAVVDQDCPELAKKVYEYLFREGQNRMPDSSEAAQALTLAVKDLRASGISPRRWAPFIHIGV